MKKILLTALLLSGCSSKPVGQVPVPETHRLDLIKSSILGGIKPLNLTNESERLAKLYLEAKSLETRGSNVSACKLFKELAANESFPLNQTALVHTLVTCSYSSSELKKIWSETTIPAYLKETYLEYSIVQAQKLKLEESIAEFSYELTPFKQVQSEKIQLLQAAVAIAKKLNLKEQEEKYFQRLTEVSPKNLKIILPENIYSVAKDFEANREFEKARELYLEIINGEYTLDEKVKAYNSYRTSFKVARDLKTFLAKTGEMELFLRTLLEASPEDLKIQEAWVETKISYARAVWTEHQNA
jgi:hypothetical protein